MGYYATQIIQKDIISIFYEYKIPGEFSTKVSIETVSELHGHVSQLAFYALMDHFLTILFRKEFALVNMILEPLPLIIFRPFEKLLRRLYICGETLSLILGLWAP